MRALRREAVRPPLVWSRGGSWCCGGSIPSGVQDGSRSRSSRIQSRACNGNTGDGVPEAIQSQIEELSLRRVSGTQKTSQDLDLALGWDVQGTGSVCCSLLKVLSVSGKCLEMSHRSKDTWASGRNPQLMGPLDSETQAEKEGTLGFRPKSLGPPSL